MLLSKRAGINLLPVPYKGAADMTTAMITGESKVMISTATEPLNAQVKAGKLRILAVASDQRSPLTPDVPLASDTVPGFVIAGWFGFIAAPHTSAADVQALANAVRVALAEPGVKERYAALYLEPRYMGPQEFAASIASVDEFYKKLVAELQLTPQ
jgi:tripartite-type tricarboxylate transporter receptor subunit TctC